MMTSTTGRSRRLSPVLRLAETKEKDAAQVVARARQRLHEYEEKLLALRAFRDEYSRTLREKLSAAMSAPQLQEYQKFIRQLDDGITLLTQQVAGQRQMSLRDEQQWITAKKRSGALDKLIGNLYELERNYHDMREANEIDDRSQHKKSGI